MKDLFLHPVDLPKLLVGIAASAALFFMTLAVADRVPYKSKHLADPSLPYTFSYPGDFKRDARSDLPPIPSESLQFVSAVHKGDQDFSGVMVGAFVPAAPLQVVTAVRVQFEQEGRVTGQKDVKVAGSSGVELRAEGQGGNLHDRTTIVFVNSHLAYWIKCLGTGGGKGDADAACDKVLGSLEITDPSRTPLGPPQIPGIGTLA
jgi:hypothetical protein